MKNIILLCLLFILSCSEDHVSTKPLPDFNVTGVEIEGYTIIETHGHNTISNTSENADSFIWDLGDGTTSTEEQVILNYPKSGVYTISLTAINSKGKSTKTKQVRVVEKALKQVVIKYLNWNSDFGRPSEWPTFTKAKVWVEIKEAINGTEYDISDNGDRDAPIIFKSQAFEAVDPTQVPITINLSEKVILHIGTLTSTDCHAQYGINLYAEDATGVYLLSSTFWGSGYSWNSNFDTNKFSIRAGNFGIEMNLYCDYQVSGV